MRNESSQEVSPQAAAALVSHLRANPQHAARPAAELATEFGLSDTFVSAVLAELRVPTTGGGDPLAPAVRSVRKGFLASAGFLKAIWGFVAGVFDLLTKNPVRFVVATTVLVVLIGFGATVLLGSESRVNNQNIEIQGVLGIAVLATFALHMATYFRHRMARYPVYGGLVVWVASALAAMIAVWLETTSRDEPNRGAAVLLVGIGMAFLAALYVGMGALVAVAGNWVSQRLSDAAEDRLSRQEQLERYFALQTRLQAAGSSPSYRMPLADEPMVRSFRVRPEIWVITIGALLTLASVFVLTFLGFEPTPEGRQRSQVQSSQTAIVLLIVSIITLISVLANIAIGFVLAKPWRSLGISLLYSVSSIPPMLLPIGAYGWSYVSQPQNQIAIVGTATAGGLLALLGSFGASVHARALREKSLAANDQASIVAEMLRIQWRLADHISTICVMVVDAAKSSVMKAEADPLAVEYSFREYQEWLERVGREHEGKVHSTAGDGAVIYFSSCEQALAASRVIQGDLERFNREDNRLKSPFRLRIGLHVGTVSGDLDVVQFTEVIDIAAHVQDVGPIGGIAVTQAVAALLPTEKFLDLGVETDGQRVFLALAPESK
jgi:class 3 adenylate cyclase